jgi:D-amino-acid dehydrogenase
VQENKSVTIDPGQEKDVIIIGGGVIGLCSAFYLQKAGYDVTIIDNGNITTGTSFGNAGYISPSHFTPLASAGIVAMGLRWMLSSTSPFYIKPRLNADLIRWCFTFWKNANKQRVLQNAPQLYNLLRLSRDLTSDMKNELGNQFRMEEKGCLMLYKTSATEKHEFELAEEAKQFGLETKILTSQEVQDLEPDVEVSVRGGILYPGDAHMHPGEFMKTLRDHLLVNHVRMQLHTTVLDFEKKGNIISAVVTDKGKFTCDELVIANGSWLSQTANKLGIKILLQAGKGYSMTFQNIKNNLHYPSILVDDRVAMTPMGMDLRMGGTMEISGLKSPVLRKRAESIFNATRHYYPGLGLTFPSIENIWYGFRPLTPDGLPYIGRHSKFNNLLIAGGHAMLGLSLAAATGKVVEEIMSNKKTSVPIHAFIPERFG